METGATYEGGNVDVLSEFLAPWLYTKEKLEQFWKGRVRRDTLGGK
jgi:hypothetical protein